MPADRTAALDRLTHELEARRAWGETTARLDLAHALADGPDGALQALAAAASDGAANEQLPAETLLGRLTTALELEPIGERGELLLLRRTTSPSSTSGEFPVLPTPTAAPPTVSCAPAGG